jgi:hypothetical protein
MRARYEDVRATATTGPVCWGPFRVESHPLNAIADSDRLGE